MMSDTDDKVVALICARGGSKGLQDKNIRLLNGKPLISYSILSALACPKIDHVMASTDSVKIAEIAVDYGAEVPFLRPTELASDTAAEWMVWRHALDHLEANGRMPAALVVLPPTAPLRADCDIASSLELFFDNDCDGVICGTDAHRNPEFNMVTRNEDGTCRLAIEARSPIYRRQDASQYFDITTVCYVMKPEFIRQQSSIFAGRILLNLIPVERSVDIDTLLDFEWAEFLMARSVADA